MNSGYYSRERVDWTSKLDAFGKRALAALGHDVVPGYENPILEALKDPEKIKELSELAGFSKSALARVVSICQAAVYDRSRGPDQDGQRKALRRHWYAYFKTRFVQPFADFLGDYEIASSGARVYDDRAWSGLLSTTYAYLVDEKDVTYAQLWVKDASRMIRSFWDELTRRVHIVIAVEKDSLFDDFVNAAEAIGALAIISGKGKNSKAAIEKLLEDSLQGRLDDGKPFIVLSLSDHDYDGEEVIGATFAKQMSRYIPEGHIFESRIGIRPEDVEDKSDSWYRVKITHGGSEKWAEQKALFAATCTSCGAARVVVSTNSETEDACEECGAYEIEELDLENDAAYGFEVEALRTGQYYELIAKALLRVLPFDTLVEWLREETTANAVDAAERVLAIVRERSDALRELQEQIDALAARRDAFENEVREFFTSAGEPHIRDFADLEDDPEEEDFVEHVAGSLRGGYPWQPFDESVRTAALVELLELDEAEAIADFAQRAI